MGIIAQSHRHGRLGPAILPQRFDQISRPWPVIERRSTSVSGGTAGLSVDLLVCSRAKGLYGGFSVDGGVIAPKDDLNQAYYGKPFTPTDILVKGVAKNAGARPLLTTVAKVASGKCVVAGAGFG